MSNIVIGQTIPEFEVVKGGVATPEGKFEVWGSEELIGKATFLAANAGHASANDMHHAVSTKLRESGEIRVAHIINAKDAPMGAGMFIKGEFKKGGINDTKNIYVMDGKGVIAKELDMAKKSSVVAVLNAEGVVVYTHEGTVGSAEEAKIMEAIASVK